MQMHKTVGPSPQDHKRDFTIGEILLLPHMLIDRDHNVEPTGLGRIEQGAVLQPRQSGESCRLAVVARDNVTQAFIYTLVQQNSH